MDIRATIPGTGLTARDFTLMRSQLDDLQVQLSTGLKSQTYGGLGDQRQQSLNMRGQLATMGSWQQSISEIDTRLNVMDVSLSRMVDMTIETKKVLNLDTFRVTAGRTQGQTLINDKLAQAVQLLNTDIGGHYLFGGRQTDKPPVANVNTIINGADGKDGFQTVMIQRRNADLGDDLAGSPKGRMTAVGVSGTTVSVTEDGAPAMPFGMKFDIGSRSPLPTLPKAITSTMPGVTAQYVSNAGNIGLSLDVTAQPTSGQSITFNLVMPDGSRSQITLTANADGSGQSGSGQFQIGATTADTANNIKTALGAAFDRVVRSDLVAASASQAGSDFFKGDGTGAPQRVAGGGTPAGAYAATGYVTPASSAKAMTVAWYVGDTLSADPRATAAARVDAGVTVSYGARADETGLRSLIQNLAVATTMDFNAADPSAEARFNAFTERVNDGLSQQKTIQTITSVRIELGAAHNTANVANERHKQGKAMLQSMLSNVEGIQKEDVAAQMLALQNQMQASFQTTASLSKLSLVDYIK